jgi:hypothetical protein
VQPWRRAGRLQCASVYCATRKSLGPRWQSLLPLLGDKRLRSDHGRTGARSSHHIPQRMCLASGAWPVSWLVTSHMSLASSGCWTCLRGVASTCQCRQHPLIHDRLVSRWRVASMAVATTTSIRHVHAGCPGLLQRRWRPLLLRRSLLMRLCCLALLARPTGRLGALRSSAMPGAGCCSSARCGRG